MNVAVTTRFAGISRRRRKDRLHRSRAVDRQVGIELRDFLSPHPFLNTTPLIITSRSRGIQRAAEKPRFTIKAHAGM
jgi:hypothetical protein